MRPASAILLLTSACLGAARAGTAAEWSAAPALGWSVDHDSNRSLSLEERPGQGANVQLDLLLKRATPDTVLSLRPHFSLQRFDHDSASDADDRSLEARSDWRTLRSQLSVEAALADQNTLSTALVDSDVVGIDTQRRTKRAALTWAHEQTKDRHSLQMQLSYVDVNYRGNDAYRLSGYRYPSATLTQTIGWTPRSSIDITVYGTRVDSDARYRSGDLGAQLGLTHALSERLTASLSGGYSRQKIERSFGPFTFSSHESGYTGQAQLTRRDPRGNWRLFASRSVTPSGFAVLVMRTEAGATLERWLAPRWSASFSIRDIGNSDIGTVRSGEAHRYERLDATLGWQLTRSWSLSAAAAVSRLERNERSPFAEGWRAGLSATWAPVPHLLSR